MARRTPRYNFTINQGESFVFPIVVKDSSGAVVDLGGYTSAMEIRKTPSSKKAIDTLTTENGRLTIVPDEGKIEAYFPDDITSAYPSFGTAMGGSCGCGGATSVPLSYDLEIYSSDGYVTRVLQGQIRVSAEVTKVDIPNASSPNYVVEVQTQDGSTKQVISSFSEAVVEVQIQGIQGAKGDKGDSASFDDAPIIEDDDIDSLFDTTESA